MKREEYSGFGRPCKLTSKGRVSLKALQEANPSASLRNLVVLFEEQSGRRICIDTMRRELLKMGVQHVRIPRDRGGKTLVALANPYSIRKIEAQTISTSRRAYPSDLTDAQWSILEPFVPKALTGGRPEEYSRRELLNAMLYLLHNGCTWRALPHDFPPWTTVYAYFRKWKKEGFGSKLTTC